MSETPGQILTLYPALQIRSIESLEGQTGLSGARLWKLQGFNSDCTYVLREWPANHPSWAQLNWIHRVLAHAFAAGCCFLSTPMINSKGQTISQVPAAGLSLGETGQAATISHACGRLWEVSHWMPGTADFNADPNPNRLRNMMLALARFHLASAQVTLDFHQSQNIQRRLDLLCELSSGAALAQIQHARCTTADIAPGLEPVVNELRLTFLRLAPVLVERLLQVPIADRHLRSTTSVSQFPAILPIQPILRDIWHDHVLFKKDEVSGIIDYGAMQMDNVAFDIARLLGSTAADDSEMWEQAILAYCEIRQLSQAELGLLGWIDQTGVLLGSYHWLRWLLLEHRRFTNSALINRRISFLQHRLKRLKP
jgi:hypothetical protein